MLLDSVIDGPLTEAGARAAALEASGIGGLFTYEGRSDPFLPFVGAAAATSRAMLYTNVAVALPRSPFHLAQQAWDLQRLSGGRFALGIGSQVKAHIQRRFSATWDRPVQQMRELIEASKELMDSWQEGRRVNYQGHYYTHTLSSPLLTPAPLENCEPPPIWCAAVGPRMTRMAAQTADGIITHPFCSARYLSEVTLPAIRAARRTDTAGTDNASTGAVQPETRPTDGQRSTEDTSGNRLSHDDRGGIIGSESTWWQPATSNPPPPAAGDGFAVVASVMVAMWETEAERQASMEGLRAQLGFYASTPAYRVVLDLHGLGDLQPELQTLTRQGRWAELGSLWDDEMVADFAVCGTPEQVAALIRSQYGGLADRISLQITAGTSNHHRDGLLSAWRKHPHPS